MLPRYSTVILLFLVTVSQSLDFEFFQRELRDDLVQDVRTHLENLQVIADRYGSRSVVNGYNASAEYVLDQLKTTDYLVQTQSFLVPIYKELDNPSLSIVDANPPITLRGCAQRTGWQHYEIGCDFAGVRFGGNGHYDITARVSYVQNSCNSTGFSGFPAGAVALVVATNDCSYYTKAINAENARASAVLLANPVGVSGYPGARARDSWKEGDRLVKIPVVGITQSILLLLRQINHRTNHTYTVHIKTNTVITIERTFNVIAEDNNDAQNVLMIGAHLDGVPAGPGINDNGSGSATVLALALQLANQRGTKSDQATLAKSFQRRADVKFRVAWWGAEEEGLVGSYYYVGKLLENFERKGVAENLVYLNFDMEGSPNFIRMVHNGSDVNVPPPARDRSVKLQQLFETFFTSSFLSYDLTGMGGGSDYFPFILAGIPASGLATGAGSLKTISDRSAHGGLALTQLDPCYHAPCDSIDNIDFGCIGDTSSAAAYTVTRILEEGIPTAKLSFQDHRWWPYRSLAEFERLMETQFGNFDDDQH